MSFGTITGNQIMEKSESALHRHKQFYGLHKNRRHLPRHWKIC